MSTLNKSLDKDKNVSNNTTTSTNESTLISGDDESAMLQKNSSSSTASKLSSENEDSEHSLSDALDIADISDTEDSEKNVWEQLDLDKNLETTMKKHGLNKRNIKTIIHSILKDKTMIQFLKSTVDTSEDESEMPEMRLTRSRMKETMGKDLFKAPWPISPHKVKPIEPKLKFTDLQLPEDDEEDKEYEPKEEELIESDGDTQESEGILGGKTEKIISIEDKKTNNNTDHVELVEDNVMSKLDAIDRKLEEDLRKNKEEFGDSETNELDDSFLSEDLISLRTRSKHSLVSTGIDVLEAAFNPPDASEDNTFDSQNMEDYDWKKWLSELFLEPTAQVNTSTASFDDDDSEADPDFNYLAEDDVVDKEDFRSDCAVRVSKKELHSLMDELNKDPQDQFFESILFDNVQKSSTPVPGKLENKVLTSDLCKSLAANLNDSSEFTSGSITTEEDKTISHEKEIKKYFQLQSKDEQSKFLRSYPHLIGIIQKLSESPPNELKYLTFTEKQYSTLQQQLQMHIQLLTQTNLLTRNAGEFASYPTEMNKLVQEIALYTQSGNFSQAAKYSLHNLHGALNLCVEPLPISEYVTNMPKQLSKKGFMPLPNATASKIAFSEVFMYGDILPLSGAISSHAYRNVKFMKAEDSLIAMSMAEFSSMAHDFPTLAHEHYLPTRTKQMIKLRIKNVMGCSTVSSGGDLNPIRLHRTAGVVPKPDTSISEVSSNSICSPVDNNDIKKVPYWLKPIKLQKELNDSIRSVTLNNDHKFDSMDCTLVPIPIDRKMVNNLRQVSPTKVNRNSQHFKLISTKDGKDMLLPIPAPSLLPNTSIDSGEPATGLKHTTPLPGIEEQTTLPVPDQKVFSLNNLVPKKDEIVLPLDFSTTKSRNKNSNITSSAIDTVTRISSNNQKAIAISDDKPNDKIKINDDTTFLTANLSDYHNITVTLASSQATNEPKPVSSFPINVTYLNRPVDSIINRSQESRVCCSVNNISGSIKVSVKPTTCSTVTTSSIKQSQNVIKPLKKRAIFCTESITVPIPQKKQKSNPEITKSVPESSKLNSEPDVIDWLKTSKTSPDFRKKSPDKKDPKVIKNVFQIQPKESSSSSTVQATSKCEQPITTTSTIDSFCVSELFTCSDYLLQQTVITSDTPKNVSNKANCISSKDTTNCNASSTTSSETDAIAVEGGNSGTCISIPTENKCSSENEVAESSTVIMSTTPIKNTKETVVEDIPQVNDNLNVPTLDINKELDSAMVMKNSAFKSNTESICTENDKETNTVEMESKDYEKSINKSVSSNVRKDFDKTKPANGTKETADKDSSINTQNVFAMLENDLSMSMSSSEDFVKSCHKEKVIKPVLSSKINISLPTAGCDVESDSSLSDSQNTKVKINTKTLCTPRKLKRKRKTSKESLKFKLSKTNEGFRAQKITTSNEESLSSDVRVLEEDTMVQLDPARITKETILAESYLKKVQETLKDDPEKFLAFLEILDSFSGSNNSPSQLYYQLKKVIGKWPELLHSFVPFLMPSQAKECGLLGRHQEYAKARKFLRKLEVRFKNNISNLEKILQVFNQLASSGDYQESEVKRTILDHLKEFPELQQEFLGIYNNEEKWKINEDSFEKVNLDEVQRQNDTSTFEYIDLHNENSEVADLSIKHEENLSPGKNKTSYFNPVKELDVLVDRPDTPNGLKTCDEIISIDSGPEITKQSQSSGSESLPSLPVTPGKKPPKQVEVSDGVWSMYDDQTIVMICKQRGQADVKTFSEISKVISKPPNAVKKRFHYLQSLINTMESESESEFSDSESNSD